MRSFAVALLLFSSGVLGDLECWEGMCGLGGEGNCTDSVPSLEKTTCPTTVCAQAEGRFNSKPFKIWGCDLFGEEYSETGCFGVTGDLNDLGINGMFYDVDACFCDAALCNSNTTRLHNTTTPNPDNSASKQILAAIFTVVLVIHLII